MRNFANKIWNAGRYMKEMVDENDIQKTGDLAFYEYLTEVTKNVTKQLDSLMIGLSAETTYNEFWHWFCDEAIEQAKTGQISKAALLTGLQTFLKLFHPFVPFVTEAIWQEMGKKKLLLVEPTFSGSEDEFRKQNCERGVLKYKNMKVKNEMADIVFPQMKFNSHLCNPCNKTCDISVASPYTILVP
jgi:valyl-tRNA synthetase